MVSGIVGGMSTLFTALSFFVLIVYSCCLFSRVFVAGSSEFLLADLFQSVASSFLTVFRCTLGDCSTAGGTPMAVHVHKDYGFVAGLLFLGFCFATGIGLMNVISAV